MSAPLRFILIGGSAGSLQVILRLLEKSIHGFRVPVLIVLHRDPQGESRLTDILAVRTSLVVKEIEDKDPIRENYIYVCPADYHVLVEDDLSFSLDYSEKEHFSRPSIDVAMRAAADVYGKGLLCVLLSGANADGAAGLRYAKQCGATTIIQSPEDAQVSYMPEQALLVNTPDHIFTTADLILFLQQPSV